MRGSVIFEVSPDLRQVARSERRLILDRVRMLRVAEDTVLQVPGEPVAQAAWVVEGAVDLTLDDEPPIRLGLPLFGGATAGRGAEVAMGVNEESSQQVMGIFRPS